MFFIPVEHDLTCNQELSPVLKSSIMKTKLFSDSNLIEALKTCCQTISTLQIDKEFHWDQLIIFMVYMGIKLAKKSPYGYSVCSITFVKVRIYYGDNA